MKHPTIWPQLTNLISLRIIPATDFFCFFFEVYAVPLAKAQPATL
jgi:hypothetical protein